MKTAAAYNMPLLGSVSLQGDMPHLGAVDLQHEVEQLRLQKDAAYAERNKCVVGLARLALELGFKAGIRQHVGADWEDDWRNVVFIDLPAGQVSWHIHDSETHLFYFLGAYDGEWDGHTTEQKYERVLTPLVEAQAS